ncbi:hypothetical protein Y032_0049g1847 [Ancylostoma ceylanicum]|uniref:Uncharacterized protein n=1 Tax=Ancylostoma ceylanicum TaxID=53326 RepID=A0A016U9R1_9BILA|nr:hypothetical protein Y032_0049g1847 [Ancylostoma ceylanicum]
MTKSDARAFSTRHRALIFENLVPPVYGLDSMSSSALFDDIFGHCAVVLRLQWCERIRTGTVCICHHTG